MPATLALVTYNVADVMPQPDKRRPRWLIPVIATGVVLVLAGVVTYFLLTRSISVTGRVELGDGDFIGENSDCYGQGGLSDISAGAEITVTGPDGTVLAFAHLEHGTRTSVTECDLPFALKVPRGQGIYTFTMERRGSIHYSEDDLKQPVEIVLD